MGENERVAWLINYFVNELMISNYHKELAIRNTVRTYVENTVIYSRDDLISFIQEAELYNVELLIDFMEEKNE